VFGKGVEMWVLVCVNTHTYVLNLCSRDLSGRPRINITDNTQEPYNHAFSRNIMQNCTTQCAK
jgi:hypothetical protein